ncbi:DNA-binding response regulator [Lysinibacillus alkalisoli]|uniref:DNA-binding response regulator n=1 Tax=Lysinibacillus alkalisoli TaxID=1911548 RepID=A0A917G0Q1_9BACI|nr:response regulator transcription factor [Lysinibacillus alkalisoli]GGG16589.1 DNA-binding response regulator [Lysinibacillus alkalisoli]
MKLLVVEDDDRLRRNISHILQKERYYVTQVKTAEEALDYVAIDDIDLLLVDWMLPAMSGVMLCQQLRQEHFQGAILMLTAKGEADDIVEALDVGADDYLTKPFQLEELLARVRALLRRTYKTVEQTITIEGITLYKDRRQFFNQQTPITLTKNEFLLLEFLFLHKGQIVSHDQIANHVWGYDYTVSINSVDALLKLVRKKIDTPSTPSRIKNIRGLGFTMRNS